nr:hypothetical protein [Tanacetum cinerariifolium]
MPIGNDKPPDPFVDEFCILTKMTSAEDLCSASFDDTKVKVMKGKHRKAYRSIKVSTPSSAGVRSILRRLRSDKIDGKARVRAEGSPHDDKGGKRVVSSPLNLDINKPPDPFVDEFCILTKMTSAEDLCSASFDDTKVKVMKGKHRKAYRSIKVSMPGSAGAGSVLRRLRSDKIAGKARVRAEGSPRDDRGGKRMVSSLLNLEINKVIADFKSGALNNNLKFAMGCSINDNIDKCSLNVADYKELCNGNDGSFIKIPLDCAPDIGLESSLVAKSYGLKTSHEHTSMGDVGILNERGIAGSGTSNEHTSMEDVPNDGGVWNNKRSNVWGSSILSNQFSVDVDRFAKKLKQGSEELALKMEYVPASVSKLENVNRRISFSAEEVFK